MKIVHVNTYDINGGAARAAYRLHRSLLKINLDSRMFVANNDSKEKEILGPISKLDNVFCKLAPHIDKSILKCLNQKSQDILSLSLYKNPYAHKIKKIDADIINLHWINEGFLTPSLIGEINKPIIWTLHDMWPFCGGEHYVGDSVRYIEGYTKKNRVNLGSIDVNRWIWRNKKRIFGHKKAMKIVAPSKWMYECAKKSSIFKDHEVIHIPNSIDENVFKPYNRKFTRQALNLRENEKVILFGAMSATSDKRKGFDLLIAALKYLKSSTPIDNIQILVFGSSEANEIKKLGFKVKSLGILKDDLSLALYYSTSDVFIAPSREDNLPNTILESMACGTPVVSFNVGGIKDMIDHNNNGFLAQPESSEELSKGILYLLSNEGINSEFSINAREKVLKNFTFELQSKAYEKLYSRAIGEFNE